MAASMNTLSIQISISYSDFFQVKHFILKPVGKLKYITLTGTDKQHRENRNESSPTNLFIMFAAILADDNSLVKYCAEFLNSLQ